MTWKAVCSGHVKTIEGSIERLQYEKKVYGWEESSGNTSLTRFSDGGHSDFRLFASSVFSNSFPK